MNRRVVLALTLAVSACSQIRGTPNVTVTKIELRHRLIWIEGADSGDVLEVRILAIALAIPYAYNGFGGRSGFIPEDFGYARTKIIPLRPFFGSMGVAPPKAMGKINSAPPGIHAGNLDNKELVAGTTLYIPVHTAGALFEVGDGHASQGNGEVDITQLVDGTVGVHVLIPKSIFTK